MMKTTTTILMCGLLFAVLASGCTQSTNTNSVSRSTEKGWTVGWSRIKQGLTPIDVLSLLDTPIEVKVNRVNTMWYYSNRGSDGPFVNFDTRTMTVDRWRSPKE